MPAQEEEPKPELEPEPKPEPERKHKPKKNKKPTELGSSKARRILGLPPVWPTS